MVGAIFMASGRAKCFNSAMAHKGDEAFGDYREGRGSRNVEWGTFRVVRLAGGAFNAELGGKVDR